MSRRDCSIRLEGSPAVGVLHLQSSSLNSLGPSPMVKVSSSSARDSKELPRQGHAPMVPTDRGEIAMNAIPAEKFPAKSDLTRNLAQWARLNRALLLEAKATKVCLCGPGQAWPNSPRMYVKIEPAANMTVQRYGSWGPQAKFDTLPGT